MRKALRGLASSLGSLPLRALVRSWRFTEIDGADGRPLPRVRGPETRELYALWHQHLLMLTLLYRDEDIAVMISRSRDGDVATGLVERLGYHVVRGSSSRGGGAALHAMIEAAGKGNPLALTVDGPRGPARVCKPGAVLISGRADIPIVPVAAVPERGRALASWDRFLVPAPGTRIFVSFGAPIRVETDGSTEDVARWQQRVEKELERAVDRCESAAATRWPRGRDA